MDVNASEMEWYITQRGVQICGTYENSVDLEPYYFHIYTCCIDGRVPFTLTCNDSGGDGWGIGFLTSRTYMSLCSNFQSTKSVEYPATSNNFSSKLLIFSFSNLM